MPEQTTPTRRLCANCRTPVEDLGILCPQCHREAARRKLDVLDAITRRAEVGLDDLIEISGLSAVDIVNIAGDGKSRWSPPADERVPVCVVCSLPTNAGSVCQPCTRRLEGRAAFA
jgi:hypothetical protein